MAHMPDLVPTLAVVAAFAQGETIITGVAHLRHKESDRLQAVATELTKMGIAVQETKDGLIIQGGRPKGARIETYNDHRIATSFAWLAENPRGQHRRPRVRGQILSTFWDFFESLG